MIMFFFIIPRP